MSSEALLPAFGTDYTPADDWRFQNSYNKKELLAGTSLLSVTEILIQPAAKLLKVEVILKIGIVLRLPFAQGSLVKESLTIIKLLNAPTKQVHCYQGIQQQSYEALNSSQTPS